MNLSSLLKTKTQTSSPLQASKWLQLPLLVDETEMQALLNEIGPHWFFLVGGLVEKGKEELSQKEFLDCYRTYIESLKQGQLPTDARIRLYFSSVMTATTDALYTFSVSEHQCLVKVEKPVIQLQPHRFDYSEVDGKFRSMVFGVNSIWWGIQFSYPQIYQDEHMQVKKVIEGSEFPNTALFKQLQKWVRQYTVATPFFVNQKRVNVPIRLGKNCFEWINQHPQLKAKGIQVIRERR